MSPKSRKFNGRKLITELCIVIWTKEFELVFAISTYLSTRNTWILFFYDFLPVFFFRSFIQSSNIKNTMSTTTITSKSDSSREMQFYLLKQHKIHLECSISIKKIQHFIVKYMWIIRMRENQRKMSLKWQREWNRNTCIEINVIFFSAMVWYIMTAVNHTHTHISRLLLFIFIYILWTWNLCETHFMTNSIWFLYEVKAFDFIYEITTYNVVYIGQSSRWWW